MATKNAVGNSLTGLTGTGTFVGATSPTLITPDLGTPSAGVLTNCTGFLTGVGYLHANISADQTVTANVLTKVQFNTEVFDASSWFDNATNYRYTPLRAGKYLVIAQTLFTGTLVIGSQISTIVYKNGAVYLSMTSRCPSTSSQATQNVCAISMNGSTDYIEIFALTPGTTFSSASGSTYVQIFYIGV